MPSEPELRYRDLRETETPATPATDQPQIVVFVQHRSFFGDVLMLSPLLHSLRQGHPKAHLVLYTKYEKANVLLAEGLCDEIVRYRRAGLKLLGDLRQRDISLLVSLRRRANGVNLIVGRLAGAKRSIGYQSKLNWLWFHQRVPYVHLQYRALKYADPAKELGLPVDLPATMRSLSDRGTWIDPHKNGQRLVLMPGGSHDHKQWGISNYLQVAERLLEADANRYLIVVMGGRELELGYPAQVAASPLFDRMSIIENASVADLARIVDGAALVFGNDCGPLHVAQMLDVPLVTLFGNWDGGGPARIESWFNPRPGAQCLTTEERAPISAMSVNQVVEACESKLSAS